MGNRLETKSPRLTPKWRQLVGLNAAYQSIKSRMASARLTIEYPMRRSAKFMAFSDNGFTFDRIDGNSKPLLGAKSHISEMTVSACRERETSTGRRIFSRSPGILHIAFGMMSSD